MKWLKPFAVTASNGVGFPTQASTIVDPGTGDVGLVWAGRYFQIGAEAIIPADSRTGRHVGGGVQLRFFLDDLFPTNIDRPIFHQLSDALFVRPSAAARAALSGVGSARPCFPRSCESGGGEHLAAAAHLHQPVVHPGA